MLTLAALESASYPHVAGRPLQSPVHLRRYRHWPTTGSSTFHRPHWTWHHRLRAFFHATTFIFLNANCDSRYLSILAIDTNLANNNNSLTHFLSTYPNHGYSRRFLFSSNLSQKEPFSLFSSFEQKKGSQNFTVFSLFSMYCDHLFTVYPFLCPSWCPEPTSNPRTTLSGRCSTLTFWVILKLNNLCYIREGSPIFYN